MDPPEDLPEIEVVARRIDILEGLRAEPLHKADMVEQFDQSRSTIDRAVRNLESAGFVERVTDGYVTTEAGRLVADRYREFLAAERKVLEARPVLSAIPHDEDLPGALLSEATVGDAGDTYALFELIAGELGRSDACCLVLPRLVDTRHVRACHTRVVRDDLEATLVAEGTTLERFGEEFPDISAELAAASGFTAKAGPVPPFGVMLFAGEEWTDPDAVVVLGYDETEIAGFVHSTDPEATEWGREVVESTFDDARDATEPIDTRDPAVDVTSMSVDRLPASLSTQGFVRFDDRYVDRREAMAPVTAWRAGLGLPEVDEGYAVERSAGRIAERETGDDTEAGDPTLAEVLAGRLRDGDDLVLVGRPGAGKSTTCKQVACAWHAAGDGPVFYRESGRGEPFDAVGSLERTLERSDGEALVVVEDAVRSDANAVFDLVQRFGGSEDVHFLLDAREEEWNDPDEFPVDAKLHAVRRELLDVVGMPPLSATDCRRILDRIEAETGERPDTPVEELLSSLRPAGDDDRAAPGEVTLLMHRLARYVDPLTSYGDEDAPTTLDEDVDRVREDLSAIGDTALDVGVLVNLLNATGIGVYPAYVQPLGGGDPDRHASVRAALDRLEGQVLFPAPDRSGPPYRAVHETWSVRFLERFLESEGERSAEQRFGRSVTALTALADDPDRRDVAAREVDGDPEGLEQLVADPERWADQTTAAVFELGRTFPKLAPLFGTTGDTAIDLPDVGSDRIAARCVQWRGRMYERAGEYDRAEREFVELGSVDGDDDRSGGSTDRLRMESLLGRSDVARKRGDFDVAADHATACMELAGDVGDDRRRGEAARRLGEIEWHRGNFERALEHYRESLELARTTGNRRGESTVLRKLGVIAWEQDDYEKARERYERSLNIKRDLGDRRGEAKTLNNLGTVLHQQGDLDGARDHFQRSLAIKRNLGDRQGEANTLNNLGVIAETLGEYGRALEYHRRSLELASDLGDRHGEAISLQNVGGIEYRTGRDERARDHLDRSLAIADDLGDDHTEGYGRVTLGWIALRRGDRETARDHFERALAIAGDLGTPRLAVRSRLGLSDLARRAGEYDEARAHLDRSRERIDRGEDRNLDGRIALERASLSLARGELDAARERAATARESFAALDARYWVARSRRLLGRIASESGDRAGAREHWRAALETFEASDTPDDALETIGLLAETELEDDDGAPADYCGRGEELLADAPESVVERHRGRVDRHCEG